MSAGSAALLQVEAREACLIVNSPRAVSNCYRTNMVRLLTKAGIPFPRSAVVDTAAPQLPEISGKTWVKRGDVHAVHMEDVTLTYRPEECAEVLEEFRRRDIPKAIVQEHLPGDTVKFYGVRGEDFFHSFYLNGGTLPYDPTRLRELAEASAEALGLFIYGGDVIVGKDGSMIVIDVNDWPSFAVVREVAAEKIASVLVREARKHVGD